MDFSLVYEENLLENDKVQDLSRTNDEMSNLEWIPNYYLLYEGNSGKSFENNSSWPKKGDKGGFIIQRLAFSPCQKYLATFCNWSIKVWDIDAKTKAFSIKSNEIELKFRFLFKDHQDKYSSVFSYSKDGIFLIAFDNSCGLIVWNLQERKVDYSIAVDKKSILSLSLDLKRLAIGFENNITIWNLYTKTEELILLERPFIQLQLSSDSKYLILLNDKNNLIYWNIKKNIEEFILNIRSPPQKSSFPKPKFSNDGNFFYILYLEEEISQTSRWLQGEVFQINTKILLWDLVEKVEVFCSGIFSDINNIIILFSPDRKFIITQNSYDYSHIYNLKTSKNELIIDTSFNHKQIKFLMFSPDSSRIVINIGGNISLRNLENLKKKSIIDLNGASAEYMVFSSDNRHIATIGPQEEIKIYNLFNSKTYLNLSKNCQSSSFLINPRYLNYLSQNNKQKYKHLNTFDCFQLKNRAKQNNKKKSDKNWFDKTEKFYRTDNNKHFHYIDEIHIQQNRLFEVKSKIENSDCVGSSDLVEVHELSQTGKFSLIRSQRLTAKIWNIYKNCQEFPPKENSDVLRCLALSSNLQIAIVECVDGVVSVWNISEKRAEFTLDQTFPIIYTSLSVNGEFVSIQYENGVLSVWNVKSKEEEIKFCDKKIQSFEFSPDGKLFSVAFRDGIKIFNLIQRVEENFIVYDESFQIFRHKSLLFSTFGRFLAIRFKNQAIKVLNLNDMTEIMIKDIGQYQHSVFSPDDKFLAISFKSEVPNQNLSTIALWNLQTSTQDHFWNFEMEVRKFSFTLIDKIVLSLNDELVYLDLKDKKVLNTKIKTFGNCEDIYIFPKEKRLTAVSINGVVSFDFQKSEKEEFYFDLMENDTNYILNEKTESFSISSDGQYILMKTWKYCFEIWNMQNIRRQSIINDSFKRCSDFKFSHDEMIMVSHSRDDKVIYIWNVADWSIKFILNSQNNHISFYFSDMNFFLASIGNDFTEIWNLNDKSLSLTINDTLLSITFSPDSAFCVAGSNKDIKIFSIQTKRVIMKLLYQITPLKLSFTHKGQFLWLLSYDATFKISFWNKYRLIENSYRY